MTLFVVAVLLALGSFGLFQNADRVARAVNEGVVKIQMGEDITGPSYQIAASMVFGFVFALAAMISLIVLVSRIGTVQ